MLTKRSWHYAIGVIIITQLANSALADVMVVANRTDRRVPMEVALPGTEAWKVTLTPGESRPIFADSAGQVMFRTGRGMASYKLNPGCVYFIGSRKDGSIDLEQIGLGDDKPFVAGLPGSAATTPAATIPVKILVDDDENTRRNVWETKLRKRVAAASEVLHRHAMIKLEVVAVETWTTDNSVNIFQNILDNFEKQVDPFPGQLAIGFCSQFEFRRGRIHMGGTRGPMRPHILLREWTRQATENEKLELLLHELGHYLGAAHSPEPDSLMRPVLGDGQARRAGYILKYDPVNTLLMSMVGEEIRRRRVSKFTQVAPATQERLKEIYKILGYARPEDPAAGILTRQLTSNRPSDPTTAAARQVLGRITQFARTNQKLPVQQSGQPGPWQMAGDEYFNQLIRVAAAEASQTPAEEQAKAFLLGVGIAIGNISSEPRRFTSLDRLVRKIETPAEATVRSTFVGKPTIQKRHDLARHFAIAAMLVVSGNRESAEAISLAKELVDSRAGSGFSFADLAADKAGIKFAQQVMAGKIKLNGIALGFQSTDFVPNISDLPEGMTTMQFIQQFGGANDERYKGMLKKIDEGIKEMPGYGG